MTKFAIFTIAINIIAMVAVIVAANRAHKKDQTDYLNRDLGEIKRGRRPW